MDLLNVGQKLSIYFEKDEKLVEITCSIAKIFDDRIVIDLPQYFMRYIDYLEVGNRLTVKVFSKVGTLDFNTMIISSPLEDEFSVELDYNAIKLTPSEEAPKINAVEAINIKHGDSQINARTFEIAFDFVKFYSDKSFKVGDILDCVLILPKNYGTISFRGTITEVDPVYENEYTISDFCISEENRQLLLYYMYLYTTDVEQDDE